MSLTLEQCRQACLRNCSWMAYANANVSARRRARRRRRGMRHVDHGAHRPARLPGLWLGPLRPPRRRRFRINKQIKEGTHNNRSWSQHLRTGISSSSCCSTHLGKKQKVSKKSRIK
uniref:Apple domain-containing protein n=1 Tax=Arundo donax TaxID=35708 RepID=A0A0A9GL28_ARUDO